jgi:hypothetical protein
LAVLNLPLPSRPALRDVTTAITPGAARAARVSIEAISPLAMAEPTTWPYAAFGAASSRS